MRIEQFLTNDCHNKQKIYIYFIVSIVEKYTKTFISFILLEVIAITVFLGYDINQTNCCIVRNNGKNIKMHSDCVCIQVLRIIKNILEFSK